MENGVCDVTSAFIKKVFKPILTSIHDGKLGVIEFNNEARNLETYNLEDLLKRAKLIGAKAFEVDNATVLIHGNNITILAKDFSFDNSEQPIFRHTYGFDMIARLQFKGNITLGSDQQSLFSGLRVDVLDLRNVDFSKLEKAKNMFSGCTITKVIFDADINLSNLKSIERIFYGSNIYDIDLSVFRNSKLINTVGAFSSACVNKGKLDLRKLDLSKIDNMTEMFCYSRTDELLLPSIIGEQSLSITLLNTFRGVTLDKLEISNIGKSGELLNIILEGTFSYSNIGELVIGDIVFPRYGKISEMFKGCQIGKLKISKYTYEKLACGDYGKAIFDEGDINKIER